MKRTKILKVIRIFGNPHVSTEALVHRIISCLCPRIETQRLFVTPPRVEGSPHSDNAKLNFSVA